MTLSKKKSTKKKTLSPQTKFALEVSRREEERLQEIIDRKELENVNMRHQIIGFRAVISYLENQLGIKDSQ
jgi:hypothetical protein